MSRLNRADSLSLDAISYGNSTSHSPINMPPNKPLEVLGIRPRHGNKRINNNSNNSFTASPIHMKDWDRYDDTERSRSNFRESMSNSYTDLPSTGMGTGSGADSGGGHSKGLKKAGQFMKMANRLAVPMMKAIKGGKAQSHRDLVNEKVGAGEKTHKDRHMIKIKGIRHSFLSLFYT